MSLKCITIIITVNRHSHNRHDHGHHHHHHCHHHDHFHHHHYQSVGFGKQGNEVMIDKVLQWCDHKAVVADVILLNSAIDAYINCGSITKAQDIFHIIVTAAAAHNDDDDDIKDNAISSTRYQKAMRELHLGFMINSKIVANVRTYNTLLKSYRGIGDNDFQQSLDIIDHMQMHRIQPNTITLNTLIDVCVTTNRLTEAEEVCCGDSTLYFTMLM